MQSSKCAKQNNNTATWYPSTEPSEVCPKSDVMRGVESKCKWDIGAPSTDFSSLNCDSLKVGNLHL